MVSSGEGREGEDGSTCGILVGEGGGRGREVWQMTHFALAEVHMTFG